MVITMKYSKYWNVDSLKKQRFLKSGVNVSCHIMLVNPLHF